jgi:Xaa-Pro aminopeptidase
MRLKEFQNYLKEEKIDLAFLVHPDINITYFTQIKPSFAFLNITSKEATLHLSGLDEKPHLKGIEIVKIKKGWDIQLKKHKVKKVGINKEVVTIAFWERLHKIFPKAKLVDVSGKLKRLRAQKTEEEIEKIQKACKVTDLAFSNLIHSWHPRKLKTEQQLAQQLEKVMQDHQANVAFPTIVANGPGAAIPHYITSNKKLSRGLLMLDFGSCYQNYNSDMSRTLILGKAKKEEKELYALLQNTQQELIEAVKEGGSFWELQNLTKKKLGKYSSHFTHLLGHGVGLEVHEAPSFSLESKETVKNNQVFTIEPGIYFYKKFGLRIEDTVLFNKSLKVLTKSSKELLTLKL